MCFWNRIHIGYFIPTFLPTVRGGIAVPMKLAFVLWLPEHPIWSSCFSSLIYLLSTLNSLLYPLSLSSEPFSLSLSHLFSRSIKCSAFSSVNEIYSSYLVISWLLQRPVSSGHKFLMQLLCAPSPWRLNSFYDISVGTETLPGSAETERHKSSGHNPPSQTPTPSGKWSFFCAPREL